MKYIRTPDTIFAVVDETDKVYRVRAKNDPDKIYSKSKCQSEIIAEADNIPILCDFILTELTAIHEYMVSYNSPYVAKMINQGCGDKNAYLAMLVKGEHGEPIIKSVAQIKNGEVELV